MFASGIPTIEKPAAKRFFLLSHGPDADPAFVNAWRDYQAHLKRTSVLIPIPPALYEPLPEILKRTILLDFPMYQFNEETDGQAALKEAQEAQAGKA